MKQREFGKAREAYAQAYRERRKTHPAELHHDLLGKAISAAVAGKAAESGIEEASDADFLRRLFLDLLGQIPTAEQVQDFLSDDSSDKRTKLIEEILKRPDYEARWSAQWTDLLAQAAKDGQNSNVAVPPAANHAHNAIDTFILERLHQRAPASRALPLRGRISVTATRRQLEALAAGALQKAEFQKQVVVDLFDPTEQPAAPTKAATN
jgi:hypothetical protein